MKMNRRSFIQGIGLGAGACLLPSGLLAAAAAKRVNILYIMSDDHAAHAISAYGSRVNKTPHIDGLAKEGVLFSNVFASNAICAPSRASILTGMYSHRNGVPVFNDISPKLETVGGYLREAGYFTAFVGKWHIGGPGTVRDSDWDRWMIYQGQGVYFDPFFFTRAEGKVVRKSFPGEYATENLTKVCKGLLDEAAASGKPFFMMMHHKAPHRNWLPSPKYRAKFRSLTLKDIPPPDSLFDDFKGRASPIRNTAMTLEHHMRLEQDLKLAEYFGDGGRFELDGVSYEGAKEGDKFVNRYPVAMREDAGDDAATKEKKRRARILLAYLRYMQDYLACVQSVDDSVGEMMDYLKAKGVADNTLVIYAADQGFFLGDHGLYDKRFMMEESIKMPFVLRCPALVATPGAVNRDIVTNVDFAPLFLDAAGVKQPPSMQGRSFLPMLKGEPPAGWRQSCYCRYYIEGGEHHTSAYYGIRTQDFKLIYYYKKDEWECFDLRQDAEEYRNIYADPRYSQTVQELKRQLSDLKASVGDRDEFSGSTEYQAKDDTAPRPQS